MTLAPGPCNPSDDRLRTTDDAHPAARYALGRDRRAALPESVLGAHQAPKLPDLLVRSDRLARGHLDAAGGAGLGRVADHEQSVPGRAGGGGWLAAGALLHAVRGGARRPA